MAFEYAIQIDSKGGANNDNFYQVKFMTVYITMKTAGYNLKCHIQTNIAAIEETKLAVFNRH
jgi:hypothetical protein